MSQKIKNYFRVYFSVWIIVLTLSLIFTGFINAQEKYNQDLKQWREKQKPI